MVQKALFKQGKKPTVKDHTHTNAWAPSSNWHVAATRSVGMHTVSTPVTMAAGYSRRCATLLASLP